MKNIIKFIQTGLLVLFITIATNAQTNTVSIGYIPTMDLESTRFGLHVGYNKVFSPTARFAPEVQVSYSLGTFEGSDDFFARDEKGSLQVIHLLGGYRAYLLNREKKTNVYLNLLGGYSAIFDKKIISEETTIKDTEHGMGLVVGLHMETQKNISLGLSVETLGAGVLKVGYRF